MGRIVVVGFGPGNEDHMTYRARRAIEESDMIIGYKTYIDLVRDLLDGQEIIRTGMTEEVTRAQAAVRHARSGRTVAVVSSGDAGIYGMAGLIYEVLMEQGWKPGDDPEVEVVPGVPALNAAASLLGAPLMHDFAAISLSDHLTPWDVIARRVEEAARADFVIVLYNPKSGRRTRQIVETHRILLQYRRPDTPVGIVKSAYRSGQRVVRTTLEDLLNHEIGMLTTVIVGNSSTVLYEGLMVTPRGYQRKYTLTGVNERGRLDPMPWSLNAARPSGAGTGSPESRGGPSPAFRIGTAALPAVVEVDHSSGQSFDPARPVLEVAVRPPLPDGRFSAAQWAGIADLVGPEGHIQWSPNHELILRIPGGDPVQVEASLIALGVRVGPTGEVLRIATCDFCEGEKEEAADWARKLAERFDGRPVPHELTVAINGCGMACYGAATEEIGLVFRRGAFEVYLGGKKGGRSPHPGVKVAEGVAPEAIGEVLDAILKDYVEHGAPKERFHKFFKRRGAGGYRWDGPAVETGEPVCGE
ncbi:MAG: precorrin-3B C(17)-methyltransferase [Alicyclobacillaceae bacterium]|nr:precorrin-3B C(17)-methyltransferase [Alicyclobacillaceae bacterium]